MEMRADVIVPLDQNTEVVACSLRAVLEHSGPILERLIVVDDLPSDREAGAALADRVGHDSPLSILRNPAHLGCVASWNRALNESRNDVVLLGCGVVVGPGWLRELADVAYHHERTACVFPLSDGDGPYEAIDRDLTIAGTASKRATILAACAGLPRSTVVPSVCAWCVYLRRDKIDAVGLFDSSRMADWAAIDDWVGRARELGFVARRANRVYVGPPSIDLLSAVRAQDNSENGALARERDGRTWQQAEDFGGTLESRVAQHAVRVEATGKLRAALDIRHLPREQVGTRTYAVNLGRALADLPELELTLLVRHRSQALGFRGRVVVADEWRDDVEVIHKPAQILDARELDLLYRSRSHFVITYQDLIGYRTALAFPTDESFEQYRATSNLTLQAAQRIVAISRSAAGEISAEFGIPRDEIAVVYHGVESGWFAHRAPSDRAIRDALALPDRYFFSLAADFPHKNLRNLLEAYAIVRKRWRDGEPPGLILAGYTSSTRVGMYPVLEFDARGEGLRFLGPVSAEQLRVLYQHATVFVFPSLYEGFGLTPLEAMAAGTPVIAMNISAVPEVVGDCALYPDGLSAASLARAMAILATDSGMRADLRARGLMHVEKFRWEDTARATFEVYRSTVLRPAERSLRLRRQLREAILRWAEFDPCAPAIARNGAFGSPGIRSSWRALDVALRARMRKQLGRLGGMEFRLRAAQFEKGRSHA
jgi:glycosyltransferase involved in cell wall biosynthesis